MSTLQTEVLGIKTRLAKSETRNDSLQEAIVNLATKKNKLLKRGLYGNKTERLRLLASHSQPPHQRPDLQSRLREQRAPVQPAWPRRQRGHC